MSAKDEVRAVRCDGGERWAGWGPAHEGGGNRALPLTVGGGCRFEYELARLEAGRSQGQLQYLDANHP